jgi:hypothetical protein
VQTEEKMNTNGEEVRIVLFKGAILVLARRRWATSHAVPSNKLEIRTVHLQNTGPEFYEYTNLVGKNMSISPFFAYGHS